MVETISCSMVRATTTVELTTWMPKLAKMRSLRGSLTRATVRGTSNRVVEISQAARLVSS